MSCKRTALRFTVALRCRQTTTFTKPYLTTSWISKNKEKNWDKFCFKVTILDPDTFTEALGLLSENPSYYIGQIFGFPQTEVLWWCKWSSISFYKRRLWISYVVTVDRRIAPSVPWLVTDCITRIRFIVTAGRFQYCINSRHALGLSLLDCG